MQVLFIRYKATTLSLLDMLRALFQSTCIFARCLATPKPQQSKQEQQEFREAESCLNTESAKSVVVRRNPLVRCRHGTGSTLSNSNRDPLSLNSDENAAPIMNPHDFCNRNLDSLDPIVPKMRATLKAEMFDWPQEPVIVPADAPLPHLHQDPLMNHVVPLLGGVQGPDPPGINVQLPVENEVVEVQAAAPLQQQVERQHRVPQPGGAADHTSILVDEHPVHGVDEHPVTQEHVDWMEPIIYQVPTHATTSASSRLHGS